MGGDREAGEGKIASTQFRGKNGKGLPEPRNNGRGGNSNHLKTAEARVSVGSNPTPSANNSEAKF
jgi:hypothetical protein